MGGFSVGELYGQINLDNSQFLEALQESGAASVLMGVRLNKLDGDLNRLKAELTSSGFSVKSLNTLIAQFYAAGYGKPQAVEQITRSIEEMQAKVHAAYAELHALSEASRLAQGPQRKVTDWSAEQEAERQRVIALIRQLNLEETELTNYRSMIEAENIRTRQIRARVAAEQDYANLTSRLAAEQAADARSRTVGGTTAVAENARILAPQRAIEEQHLRDMAKMREFYTAQANAAEVAANTVKEAEKTKIETEAAVRRAEVQRAELAFTERMYAEEVAAAKAAAAAKVAAERTSVAERSAVNRVVTQASFLGGGFVGGHAASLAMFSLPGAAAAGTVLGLGLAAKEAADFDKIITQTTANLSGMTAEMKDRLSAAALDLSTKFPIAAEEIAKAFKSMKENGYDAVGSLSALPVFVKFAAGTMSTLDESIEHLTSAQRTFKLESADQATNVKNLTDIANVVVKLNELGGASAVEYAKSLSAAGAEAHKFGLDVRDVGAAVRVLALQDIDGSRAGEVLARVLVVVTSAAEKNSAVWKQLGVNIYDANNHLKPMSEVMDELSKVIGTSDPKLNAFNTNLLGLSTRADKYVAALLNQTRELHNARVALNDVNGAMDRLASKRGDNFADQWALAFADIKRGAVEALTPVVRFATELLKLRNEFKALKDSGFYGSFGILSGEFHTDAKGNIKVGPKPQPAPAPNQSSDEPVARSAARAEEFTTKFSNSLPVLRKELTETDKLIKKYFELLSTPNVADKDRDKLEPEYQGLLTKRTEIQSKIDEITGKGVDLRYRTNAAIIQNEENHTKAMIELALKQQGEITRIDAESLRQKRDNQIQAINEELQATLKAIDAKAALEKGKSGGRINVELEGDRQAAMDAAANKAQDIDNEFRKSLDSAELRIESLLESLKNLRNQYLADLRNFSAADRELMEQLFNSLEAGVKAGLDPKILEQDRKLVDNYYQSLRRGITETTQVQNELTDAVKKYNAEQAKELKQKPEITKPLSERIDPRLAAKVEAGLSSGEVERLTQIDNILKALGTNQSQSALNLQAAAARGLVAELSTLGATSHDVHSAMVKMWEAEAAASHKSVESVSDDARKYYREYKREVENSVVASNRYWKQSLEEVGRSVRSLVSNFSKGLLDIISPKSTDTKDKLAPLVTAFRDVYEQLSSYSDPKRALEGVIKAIQTAGTQAQANAIAVKYFGQQAGPMLAQDLRSGTLSAKEIADAIDRATKNTIDYANETKSATSLIRQLWMDLVRDIVKLIAEQLIKVGLAELLKWIFDIKGAHMTLGQVVVEVWHKISDAIFGTKKAAQDAVDAIKAASGAWDPFGAGSNGDYPGNGGEVPGGGSSGVPSGGGGGVAGGAGSALSGIMQITNVVTGAVSAIANVVQAFQLHGIGNDTGKMEVSLRGILAEALNLRADEWDREGHLMAKLDDIWREIREGSMFGYLKLVVSKLDEFLIPDIRTIATVLTSDKFAFAGPAFAPAAVSGGMDQSVNIEGDVVLQANNPDQFVRELKARRIVRGRRG